MPLERDRYPENWEAISNQVRELAGWRCETCGKHCMKPGEDWLVFMLRTGWTVGEAIAHAAKPKRFRLTTAHLDQDPSNNDPGNLKALCLPCHLQHDRPFQIRNAIARLERRGQLNLMDLVEPSLAGHGRNPKRIQLPIRIRL
jgi:hypothetical protein